LESEPSQGTKFTYILPIRSEAVLPHPSLQVGTA